MHTGRIDIWDRRYRADDCRPNPPVNAVPTSCHALAAILSCTTCPPGRSLRCRRRFKGPVGATANAYAHSQDNPDVTAFRDSHQTCTAIATNHDHRRRMGGSARPQLTQVDYAEWGTRMSEPTGVPAGWYPNPENPAQQRYWDGQQWSAHTADATASNPTTPSQSLAAPGFIVTTYGESGDLLVNEIGNYNGEVVLGAGPELIQIQSDGHWTLKTTG
jgi:hypothetical protein